MVHFGTLMKRIICFPYCTAHYNAPQFASHFLSAFVDIDSVLRSMARPLQRAMITMTP